VALDRRAAEYGSRLKTGTTRQTHLRDLAAHSARVFPKIPTLRKSEGAGNAGCALHPQSRVQTCTKNAHEHTGSAEAIRHSLRNGFNGFLRALPVIGLSCHRHFADFSAKLDARVGASGPHDFAVRFCAVRQRHFHVHRIPPHVRDDRAPLWGAGRCGL
jgi:hypothetical protein